MDEEGGGAAGAAAEDGGSGGKEEGANLPFEGKLLMFRRGNGVEETKGRLLLKKLDYLQAQFLLAGLKTDRLLQFFHFFF